MEFVEWIRQTTPKVLSEITTIPLTKVEHWFRKDAKGFSHPSIEDWNMIKYHLKNWQQWDYQLTYEESIQWKGMLPTPTAGEHKHGKTEKYWENRIQKERQEDLSMMAYKGMLPTPTASDKNYPRKDTDPKIVNHLSHLNNYLSYNHKDGKNSQLNPRFVAEMMGFPPSWTELPFLSGEQKVSKDMETP